MRFSITWLHGAYISRNISDIETTAKDLAKRYKEAVIFKDDEKIGWVGKDQTQPGGWGFYIDKDLI